jgi:hypothetical protein
VYRRLIPGSEETEEEEEKERERKKRGGISSAG